VCSRIVSIVGVRGLVLTSGYRGVLGLMVHGRADNLVYVWGKNAAPIRGEVRGSVGSRWGFLRGEMEVGFVYAVLRDRGHMGLRRDGGEMAGI
jgi:hypothetical protein